MSAEHLEPVRGWHLIRDRGTLTPAETQHLRECSSCHGWFAPFTERARQAGFAIAFEIPKLEKKEDSAKGA
jgi:predicted anti-sigma-YlaC factor YlaD